MRDDAKTPEDALLIILNLNDKSDYYETPAPNQALSKILAFMEGKTVGSVEILALSDALECILAQQDNVEWACIDLALELIKEGKPEKGQDALRGNRYSDNIH